MSEQRKKPSRRKAPDRRRTSAGAWVLGSALPSDRRSGADRRREGRRER